MSRRRLPSIALSSLAISLGDRRVKGHVGHAPVCVLFIPTPHPRMATSRMAARMINECIGRIQVLGLLRHPLRYSRPLRDLAMSRQVL
jgi:hypothetical protein